MTQTENGSSFSKTIIIVAVILVVVVLMCGGPLTWWFARRSNAFAELERRRAELVDRGLPIDNTSMEAFRERTMSKEKSDRWTRLLEQFASDEFSDSCYGVPIVGVPDDDIEYVPGEPYKYDETVSKFLEQWTDLRKELHELAEGTGPIWTEIEFDSFNTQLNGTQTSRALARTLTLEFEDALRREDHDQAFHSLLATIGVSRSLEAEPLVISQLVRVAIMGVALQNLKVAIELDILSEAQLLAILEQLKPVDDYGSLYRLGIAGERALALPVFNDFTRFSEDAESSPSAITRRPIDALASLDVYEKMEAIPDEDLTVFFSEVVAVDEEISRELTEAGWLRKMDTMVTSLTVPALGAVGKSVVRITMQQRFAKAAIGIRLYEERNGSLPSSLDDLTEKNIGVDLGPISPIGANPFGYRANGDGSADLWGFSPETPNDSTPNEPIDVTDSDNDQKYLRFWHCEFPTPR